MSPALDRGKRGSGQSLHLFGDDPRPPENGYGFAWRMTRCSHDGWARTFRGAQNAIDRHQCGEVR